jgi:HNH endonuclease
MILYFHSARLSEDASKSHKYNYRVQLILLECQARLIEAFCSYFYCILAAMKKLDNIVAESRKSAELRGHSYRDLALKMYPWICTKCTREFTRENLIELTVHHKDHNHDNNPADGSNWELLCVYCHDNEHSRHLDAASSTVTASNEKNKAHATSKPFANLKDLLNKQG